MPWCAAGNIVGAGIFVTTGRVAHEQAGCVYLYCR